MKNLRRSTLRGLPFAILIGAYATSANGQTTTTATITSPASGSTITYNGSQSLTTIEYKRDPLWNYAGFTVNQVVNGVPRPVTSGTSETNPSTDYFDLNAGA